MVEKRFSGKDIIFKEGDASDHAYVVLSGQVEILKHGAHGEVQLAVLDKGATLGEMGLFAPDTPRSATARCLSDVVVDVISEKDFHTLLEKCPPRIMPIINSVLDRLRNTNQRVSEAEQATVILDSDISKIIVSADKGELKDKVQPAEIMLARLPFRIGGYPRRAEEPPTAHNIHMLLPCSGPPLVVSKMHCEIAIEDGGVFMVDLGSRFTTLVNGLQIGRGKGKYRAPLQKGVNEIVLGGHGSPYILSVACE